VTEATLIIKVNSTEVDKASKSLDQLSEAGGNTDKSSQKLTKSTESLAGAARMAIGAFTALGASISIREIIQASDAWKSAENQLRLVTTSTADLANTQKILMGVSNETRSSFESTANLYSRLTRATSEMGLSQAELVDITETINKSFAVSGATATEAAAAITQLSQGLAAGALRGDEFNSVAEQAPGIMQAIAKSLNMTTGDLRAFAAEGGITAEIVVTALQQASDSIAEDFGKSMMTFGQATQIAKNNALEFVGSSEAVTSATEAAGAALIMLTENLDAVLTVTQAMAVLYAGNFLGSMVAAKIAMVEKTAATAAQTTATILQLRAEIDLTAANVASTAAQVASSQARVAGALGSAASLGAVRSAEVAATVAVNAHTAALARYEAVAVSATATTGILASAIALAGGWVGIAVVASYAVYKLVDAYIDHNKAAQEVETATFLAQNGIHLAGEEFADVVAKIDAATQSLREYVEAGGALSGMIENGRQEAAQRARDAIAARNATDAGTGAIENFNEKTLLQIDALKNEQLALQMTDRAQAIFNATLKALANGAAPDAIAKIATLAAQNYDLKESQDDAKDSLKQWNDSIKEYLKEQKQATEEQAKAEQAVQDSIVALENENIALGMTARAQAIFNVVTEEYSKGTAPEQIARLAELTAINYDLAESSATTGKAAADAAEAAKKSWEATHEYLSDAFVDIMENGGNAFDNIAKAFEKTVKRMVAEWAASGLMTLFTGGGMSGFTMPSFGAAPANPAGSLISSATGSAGGVTLAGAAAGAGQFVAGAAGTATGIAAGTMGPPTAAAAAGAGSMASIAALATNPATIAIAAALALAYAAKNDFFKDPDNYQRSFSGFLTAPTAGAQGSTFAVDPFASGFQATGIARGASQEAATAQIEVFRQLDAAGAELVKKLGGVVDLSMATLAGVGQEGTAGTSGTFLGTGGMTTAADIAAMTDLYMTQFADHITGLDAELLKAVQSAGSAEEVMKLLTDSVAEISETAKTSSAELTNMEQARKSASESVLAAYNSGLSELDSVEKAYEAFQKYAERGLTAEHISDFTGLMESEINAVIARGAARIQAVTKPAAVDYDFWTPVVSTFQQSIRDSLINNTPDNSYVGAMGPQSNNLPQVNPSISLNGSFANGVDYVAFDGPAMLHRGEKVTSVAERNTDTINNRRIAEEMGQLKREMQEQKVYNRRTFEILDRWAGSNFTVIV
jgi:tape measure domain-containing protein